MPIKIPLEDRFNQKWVPITETGCWIWIGNDSGSNPAYGKFHFEGKTQSAHRVSYMLYNGFIEDGFHVCHKCDVPECVNPDHLFLGTHQENMKDMVRKKRSGKVAFYGEDHPNSKLTKEQVKEIRESELTPTKLAQYYPVSRSQIQRIKDGTRWGKRS